MKYLKFLCIAIAVLTFAVSATAADNFSWTGNFNRQANADPQEFRLRMAERFKLSDMQVIALRNIFASPADAYIMLRLGEIRGDLKSLSREQAIEAVNTYRSNRSRGWDILAAILGIKTESKEYLTLKRGNDLYGFADRDQVAYRENVGPGDNL